MPPQLEDWGGSSLVGKGAVRERIKSHSIQDCDDSARLRGIVDANDETLTADKFSSKECCMSGTAADGGGVSALVPPALLFGRSQTTFESRGRSNSALNALSGW
jgi:hypothetical protein